MPNWKLQIENYRRNNIRVNPWLFIVSGFEFGISGKKKQK